MKIRTVETSPRFYARIVGELWFIVIVAGVFTQFFGRTPAIVPGDAAATASNILASESLFRLDLAADLISSVCYLGLTVILYELLKPLSRSISLVAACFGLVGVTTGIMDVLNHFAPLVLLGNAQYLAAVKPDQLQMLALSFLKLHSYGYTISLVFFGCQCFLCGWLVFSSTFLPRIIGVLLMIAGLAYLVISYANFLSPPFAHTIFPLIAVCGLAGEGSMSLWLIVKAVDGPKWEQQAIASREAGA
jgi:hypothetical protein